MQIRVLVFSKFSGSIKSGTFSGGYFSSFCFSKIGSCFLLLKFLFKFTQVANIGFVVFSQVLVSKWFHFARFVFFWLAFFSVKSGFQNRLHFFSKSFGKFGLGFFCQVRFFWQSKFFARSVFSEGFGKFSALRFGKSVSFSMAKSGL